MTQPFFLFAEDDDDDWFLIQESFDDIADDTTVQIRMDRVKDGLELLQRLEDPNRAQPDLILMDLKMPKINGHEALDAIRAKSEWRHLPVVILTTSTSERDRYTSYYKGANSYLVKPLTTEAARTLRNYWLNVSHLPCNNCGDSCLEYGCPNR